MKKLLLFIQFTALFFYCHSQETGKGEEGSLIRGHIVDSVSHKPVEYATITIADVNSGKVISGAVADKNGKFIIQDIKPGVYRITVEFIGYEPSVITALSIDKNKPLIDLKDIALSVKQQTLQNVTVSSSKGLIENRIDKLVYNAEKDLTSLGGVATDILKKVPQVSVDVDGNVELAGSNSIRFLINGRPSAAFGSNIADVLQSIPASQIKSIEVITNPGAKYDAQGLGGIINIILKESRVKGINGNLSLTDGTRNENGSFNLNARKGNFGINTFISSNVRLNVASPNSSERSSADTAAHKKILLDQEGMITFRRAGFETGAGFDWTYKKHNSFSGSLRYGTFNNNNRSVINQTQTVFSPPTGPAVSTFMSENNTRNKFLFSNIDAGLNYKRTFSREDQELEINLNTSRGKSSGHAGNEQFQMPQDSLYYATMSDNPATENETEFEVGYTQPVQKDIVIGLGGKISLDRIISFSNVQSFQASTHDYDADSSLTNNLDYRQKVYALYSEFSFPIKEWLDVKIGGRYERTEINSFYSNAQHQTPQHGYNTVVPSIFFSHKLNDDQLLKLSYSRRIERPDYGDLNPFINTSDPNNISAGNPYLKPEIGDRYELSYTLNFKKAGSLMITAFFRNNKDDIQPFIVFYPLFKAGDSIYTNVAVSTRQNIGIEKNKGMSFFVDIHPGSALTLRSNLSFFYRHTINVIDPGFNYNSFNYRFNLNASYQFGKNLSAEFFGNFNSPRHEAQGRYPSFTTYSFAVRKQFWSKKGSLALSLINPFAKYVDQKTELFGSNFTLNGFRSVPFRSIALNFTWKFGKLEFKKKEEDKQDTVTPPEG